MSSKTRCFFLSLVLGTFLAHANVENGKWIFHAKSGPKTYPINGEVRGTPYVLLAPLLKEFSLKSSTPSESEIEISNPKTKFSAKISTKTSKIVATWSNKHSLSRSPLRTDSAWRVPIDFGDRVLRPLLYKEIPPLPLSDRPLLEARVLIDPGHGGNDYGTTSGQLREKDFTLVLGKELAAELEKLDVPVALTRHRDVFLSLQERTQMAHRSQAELFISIHLNSEPTAKSSGFEVYILSLDENNSETIKAVATENQIIPQELPEGVEKTVSDLRAEANFERSLMLAKLSQSSLSKYLRPFGKAVKAGPFYVLYGVSMPALLIEFGFLNSSVDQKWLQNSKQRALILSRLAEELAKTLKSAKSSTL